MLPPMASTPAAQRLGPDDRVVRIPTPTGLGVGDVHAYLILPADDADAPVLIDTGVHSDEAWAHLEQGFASVGRRVEELGRVLLTHAHPDHFGQAARIAAAAGCPVWGHRLSPRGIAAYTEEPGPEQVARVAAFYERLGVPPDRARRRYGPPGGLDLVRPIELDHLLADGDRVTAAGLELEVLHVPGHCPDLVVYWHAPSGTLFSGDHLLPDITPVCMLDVPDREGDERVHTLTQFHRSIDRVEPLKVKLVLPSHGEPLPGHRRLIASYRLHTEQRALKIARRLARRGWATPFEVGRGMFPNAWEDQLHLVLSEVMGHLDVLEEEGHVRVEERDGVLHYGFVSLPDPA